MKFFSKHRIPLILFIIVLSINLTAQFSTPSLISLDSWTLYHILEGILHAQEILPRADIYLLYPLAYLPLLPFAKIFGTLTTLKFIYPLIPALSVFPLYKLLQKQGAQKAALGTLAIILIDDFVFRAISVTPQGMASLWFFAALLFLTERKKWKFLITGIIIILTHHLTSLVLVFLVCAYLIHTLHERKRETFQKRIFSDIQMFAKILWQEKIIAVTTLFFFLDWGMVSTFSDKNIYSLYLVLKIIPSILIFLFFFLLTLKYQIILLDKIRNIRHFHLSFLLLMSFAFLFLFITQYSTHSFLSTYSFKSLFVVPLYVITPIVGIPYLLKKKNEIWLFWYVSLTLFFIFIIVARLNCVFDAYRLIPFSLIPLCMAILEKTKKGAFLLITLVLISLIGHLSLSYQTLIYTQKQIEAARWASELPKGTVATDTKMSALFLGLSNLSATFEGSYWVFSQDDLLPWIKTFNTYRFLQYPIRYIATSRYMFEKGADISWSTRRYVISEKNKKNYSHIGKIIFDNGDVTIWEIDPNIAQNSEIVPIQQEEKGFIDTILSLWSPDKDNKQENDNEVIIDPKTAYGSTCQ